MSVSPPKPKGPPLNALRAFEAAGRLGGFAMAAEELHVTPGAIAQHIKALEEWFGADLFERHSKGVILSDLGQNALSDFTQAFDQLGDAVQTLRSRASPHHVRIAALPSIAQLWLSPRLPSIRSAAPDVTISVTAMEQRPNLNRELFDLSIFYGSAPSRENLIDLGPDIIFPVCAPALAQHLDSPDDLANMTFLHDAMWANDWAVWMDFAMEGNQTDSKGPVYSLFSLAVEETKNGAGVLIGHQDLVEQHLNDGTLVAPFDLKTTTGRRLVLEIAPQSHNSAILKKVINSLQGR